MVSEPRQVLGTLQPFSGNYEEYEDWRLDAENKLRTEVVRRLMDSENCKPSDVLNHFDHLYIPANTSVWAHQKLHLPQGKVPIRRFLPKFEARLTDARGHDWPDESKILTLTGVLDKRLFALMSLRCNGKETFAEFCQLDLSCEGNDGASRYISGLLNDPVASGPSTRAGDPMDLSHTYESQQGDEIDRRRRRQANQSASGIPTHDAQGRPYPTDSELRGRRAKWVTREELSRRKALQACLRCARPRCRTSRCPLSPPVNPAKQPARSNAAQQEKLIPALAMDDIVDDWLDFPDQCSSK
ncbi:hypothetical protein Cpir12675_001715 [Ceratocystis pirilliformis]|uniref:Uncharacterized protein n=1 Tax=Ceratocystis pirilliformis TaxID=259994 RepID=A0ABR3ZFJ0_9PEZI